MLTLLTPQMTQACSPFTPPAPFSSVSSLASSFPSVSSSASVPSLLFDDNVQALYQGYALGQISPPCVSPPTLSLGLELYNNQYVQTPISTQFFDPENVAFILSKIKCGVEAALGITHDETEQIYVPMTYDLITYMNEVLSQNQGLQFTPQALGWLNRMVIDHEVIIQIASLRHRKLFQRYFIDRSSMRVFPRPELTHGKRGEFQLSSSKYYLTNPWNRNYNAYLKDVLHVKRIPAPTPLEMPAV